MNKSESIKSLAIALSKAQSAVVSVSKNKTAGSGDFQYKYADLEAILKVLKPIMEETGLSLAQFPVSDEQGRVGIENILTHESGEWLETALYMDVPTGRQPAQEVGKVLTYLRRYSISGIFNIATDDDTDGEVEGVAEPKKKTTEKKKPVQKTTFAERPKDAGDHTNYYKLTTKYKIDKDEASGILKECGGDCQTAFDYVEDKYKDAPV